MVGQEQDNGKKFTNSNNKEGRNFRRNDRARDKNEKNRSNNKSNSSTKKYAGVGVTCYNCNGVGHFSGDCPSAPGIIKSKTLLEAALAITGNCYTCGQPGHHAVECPKALPAPGAPNSADKNSDGRVDRKKLVTMIAAEFGYNFTGVLPVFETPP